MLSLSISLSIPPHHPPGSDSSLIHHPLQPDDVEMVSIAMPVFSLLIKWNLLTSYGIKPRGHFSNEGRMGQMWGAGTPFLASGVDNNQWVFRTSDLKHGLIKVKPECERCSAEDELILERKRSVWVKERWNGVVVFSFLFTVPTIASDSWSWLTGVQPDDVFCFCSLRSWSHSSLQWV